jgi:hypothetical protein
MAGLFTLVSSVQYFARSIGLYVGIQYGENYGQRKIAFLEWLMLEDTIGSLAGCVLGLWLVFGSRALVRLIRRLRRSEFAESSGDLSERHESVAGE